MEEHGQLHGSAVSPESVKTGVVNDERFERLVADIQGFGRAPNVLPLKERAPHDERTCTDKTCPHPAHGSSTSGENFEKPLSAGTVYNGEDGRPKDERTEPEWNDPAIATGNVDAALSAIAAARHDPDDCTVPKCTRCNRVDDADLQPGYTVAKGGGSKSGRKKKKRGGGGGPAEGYIMVSYETEESRAKRLARENAARIENGQSRPGRKIKGKEKRMHVQGTMEPQTVADLNDMTGKTVVQAAEVFCGILAIAKSGAQAQAVLDAVMDVLENSGEEQAA